MRGASHAAILRKRLLWSAIIAAIAALVWISARQARVADEAATRAEKAALLAQLQTHFDLATQDVDPKWSRMETMPHAHSAGMDCAPARLTAKSTTFQIILPKHQTNRKGVLAVIDPDGDLKILYISYSIDTDPEDLIIPSRAIDWEMARSRNDFTVDARSLDALMVGAERSTRLFLQPGIYQFGLLNSIDRELLKISGDKLRVKAGCVIDWQP